MDIIIQYIWKAIAYLFIAGIVFAANWFGKYSAEKNNSKFLYLKGFVWCVCIALVLGGTSGGSYCEEYSDPIFGGCERYSEEFIPLTDNERIGKIAYYVTLFYIPVFMGIQSGIKKNTLNS